MVVAEVGREERKKDLLFNEYRISDLQDKMFWEVVKDDGIERSRS